MKRTIRRGVFETNSSSVHSMVICSDEEWRKWQLGELVYDYWSDKLIEVTDETEPNGDCYFDFGEVIECSWFKDYHTFSKEYTTESGDLIHIFGYYGCDG